MSVRAGHGWQTSLADLSLILFIVTAATVSRQPQVPALPSRAAAAPSPQTEPLSVYVAAPDAPPLADWLREQAADPRQQLTITAHYGSDAGAQARALAQATRLLAQAGAQGQAARMVVEPGEGPVRAVLAYDAPRVGESGE
ncbi:hypothetical protein [Novosphingobium mangrovi (ex Huang et al. 2023)]|uniref:Biopolymer transporter ExbD n=1 Tax=Novosphingobium mangrovi (ex Huang et al. 2023) TaxID=2976432 RepID=A0ABT2I030_9SPHN|nr:hypothetical protein [Novosphingobium mangrovi (ex Huang et al. 2023)]MCT2398149.1 hypothetical protein [Novosphingobium mangrovi (ex Huang et al. 2023)]